MQDSYDEVFAAPGRPREHARRARRPRSPSSAPTRSSDAGRMRDSIFMQQGITFDAGGPDADGPVRDRPFPLDLVPRIIPAAEWRDIKRGLAQRIRALNAFVDDVYHAREIVHEGIVPWELIVSRSALRARRARDPPARRRLLPRLRLRPRARRRRLLEGARGQRPHAERHLLRAREPRRDDAPAARPVRLLPRPPVDHYPALLRTALTEVAPTSAEEEATVVVWTPGPFNSAYFEHAFLARQMGVELVEASDLVVRDADVLHPHDQRARSACTRSTAGSTTTSWTRSSSARTRCSACPA